MNGSTATTSDDGFDAPLALAPAQPIGPPANGVVDGYRKDGQVGFDNEGSLYNSVSRTAALLSPSLPPSRPPIGSFPQS